MADFAIDNYAQQREKEVRRARTFGRFRLTDSTFRISTLAAVIFVLALLGGVMVALAYGSLPAFRAFGFGFFITESWNPVTDKFGALAAIYGTVVTSLIAMLIAVPVGIGSAIFLTELCPHFLRRPIGVAIELLAAIPSIIYGLWGLFILAPFVQEYVQPGLISLFGNVPILSILFAGPPYGIGILTAGFVLAIMVLPFITSISRDVFETVPPVLKEAGYGLGCTTWEVSRNVVLPYTGVGVIGGIMLGLGRALGETMAVTFVIGNAHRISGSLLAPGTTISASIANEFTEAVGDLYTLRLDRTRPHLVHHHLHRAGDLTLHASAHRTEEGHLSMSRYAQRRRLNFISIGLCYGAAAFGLGFLLLILIALVGKGARGLSLDLFTQMTPPPGSKGGLLNAIYGSLVMTFLGVAIGTPLGMLAGTYMAEYGRGTKLTFVVRFINDILLSAPSIVIGLFVYEVLVAQMGHFSGIAGAVALAIIVVPVVVRTTEDMLLLVPGQMREAAAALGPATRACDHQDRL